MRGGDVVARRDEPDGITAAASVVAGAVEALEVGGRESKAFFRSGIKSRRINEDFPSGSIRVAKRENLNLAALGREYGINVVAGARCA